MIVLLFISLGLYANDVQVPTTLYHASSEVIISSNVKAGSISQRDWKNYVMGGSGKYNLSSHRRGLYGETLHHEALKWGKSVMQVQLKEACLDERHVMSAEEDSKTVQLDSNHELRDWLERNVSNETRKLCTNHINEWRHGGNIGEVDKFALACDKALTDYMDENEKWIIKDDFIKGAWYIRNRDCIQGLSRPTGIIIHGAYMNAVKNETSVMSKLCNGKAACTFKVPAGIEDRYIIHYSCSDALSRSKDFKAIVAWNSGEILEMSCPD